MTLGLTLLRRAFLSAVSIEKRPESHVFPWLRNLNRKFFADLGQALTEETVKLISAFGARCPCCLRDAGGWPWFPCCIPGWNAADPPASGVTDPCLLRGTFVHNSAP